MKNKISKTALIIFIFFIPVLSNGQEIDLDLLKLDDYVKLHNNEASNTLNSYNQIDGTPYLFEEFTQGKVTTKDSLTYHGLFRYDIYADNMEFESLSLVLTMDPLTIETIAIGSHTFLYIPQLDEASRRGAYYELILPGKCRLLQKRKVVLNEPQKAKPYVDAKPASFSKGKDVYYLQNGDNPLQKITGKKSLIEALEDHGQEIKAYMKHNKVSPHKLTELIDLINYYNQL
ncbi:MAG: hypothetical protein U9N53_09530 [Bacteroidota bacterium]|nr:hypothetical protein [Bacteroidota bacterium]